jgi:hypothetical protein
MHGAVDIVHRLHLSRNRAGAEERVQNLGPGAKRWRDLMEANRAADETNDVPIWFALILLEAFTLLREQFRLYPVDVLSPADTEANVVWLAPRDDADRDVHRETMGLRPAAEALRRELRYDDGKANWVLSQILLGDTRSVISTSPQEGYLHQVSELDTLGVDKPETKCVLK